MDRISIGYIARAHGVQGEVRVHLHDPSSTTLQSLDRAWFGGVERRILGQRPTSGAWLLRLDGVTDRDAAEALRGNPVEVSRDDIELAPDEYLLADLPGCHVTDESGASLGRIMEILSTGGQDILVIHDDTHERLLPMVPEFVLRVDVAARQVQVALPEDLPVEPLRR